MYHHSYASKVIENRYVSNNSYSNRKGLVRKFIDAITKSADQK